MARIEWTRIEPGDIEHVIAMMLARENIRAQRIRPARGDHGIDVISAEDDGALEVYQVKSFHTNLTSGQKSQIAESLRSLRKWLVEKQVSIRRWHLVLPLDPTPQNIEWLHDLGATDSFQVEWHGRAFVDALAAKYPDVIDYYLRDGKERLERAVSDLTALLRLSHGVASDRSGPLTPDEAQIGLGALHEALNRYDPHYRYDFSVDAVRPDVPDQPMLVFATQVADASKCVTFKVFARCHESMHARPVPIRVTMKVLEGDTAKQFRDWMVYGMPFQAPLGSADFAADLPGGLGGTFEGAAVTFGSATGGKPYTLRLELLSPNQETLATCRVEMNPVTAGVVGEGWRASGTESSGVFDIEIRMRNPIEHFNFSVSSNDIQGARPSEIMSGVRFMAQLHHPNALRFALPYGPATAEAIPLPEAAEDNIEAKTVLQLVEALATIQEHTTVQILVPDFTEMRRAEAAILIRVARLLRGDVLKTRWKAFDGRVHATDIEKGSPATPEWEEALSVRLAGQDIHLGSVKVVAEAAQIQMEPSIADPDGFVIARLEPFQGNDQARMSLRDR